MWFQLGKKGLTSKQVHDQNVGLGGGGGVKNRLDLTLATWS